MAIRRCPYCKAIIDESQKYCNNCGTQLLFPQDEEIEEDIKGEKIRDDDFRDEEPPEEEAEAVKEEIDLEKILEDAAPFPDDLGGSETDEIEPTPAEPIVKPIPKPRAAPKPKIPTKPQPEPQTPRKPKPEPERERKLEPIAESKPAPKPKPAPRLPAPSQEPDIEPGPVSKKAEKTFPDVPATPPIEIKSESVRREASGMADEDEAWETTSAPAAEKEAEPETDAVRAAEDHEDVLERPEELEEAAGAEAAEEDEDYGLGEGIGLKDEDLGAGEIEDIEAVDGIEDKEEFAEAGENEEAEIDRNLREEEGSAARAERAEPVASAAPIRPAVSLEDDLDAAEDKEHPEGDAVTGADEDRDEAETRQEIARLIEALEKKHKKIPLTRDEKKTIAPLEETSGLPAWAESSQTTRMTKAEHGDDAGVSGEGRSFAPGDTMDFEEEVMRDAGRNDSKPTIGIPETLSKIEILGRVEADREEAEEEGLGRAGRESGLPERVEPAEEAETEPVPSFVFRKRLGFSGVLKAGIYDLFFVALLWFAAVWLAAQILTLPVQTLIFQAAVPLGLFFGVLLLGYLFLFLFFLGETLGGRLVASKR